MLEDRDRDARRERQTREALADSRAVRAAEWSEQLRAITHGVASLQREMAPLSVSVPEVARGLGAYLEVNGVDLSEHVRPVRPEPRGTVPFGSDAIAFETSSDDVSFEPLVTSGRALTLTAEQISEAQRRLSDEVARVFAISPDMLRGPDDAATPPAYDPYAPTLRDIQRREDIALVRGRYRVSGVAEGRDRSVDIAAGAAAHLEAERAVARLAAERRERGSFSIPVQDPYTGGFRQVSINGEQYQRLRAAMAGNSSAFVFSLGEIGELRVGATDDAVHALDGLRSVVFARLLPQPVVEHHYRLTLQEINREPLDAPMTVPIGDRADTLRSQLGPTMRAFHVSAQDAAAVRAAFRRGQRSYRVQAADEVLVLENGGLPQWTVPPSVRVGTEPGSTALDEVMRNVVLNGAADPAPDDAVGWRARADVLRRELLTERGYARREAERRASAAQRAEVLRRLLQLEGRVCVNCGEELIQHGSLGECRFGGASILGHKWSPSLPGAMSCSACAHRDDWGVEIGGRIICDAHRPSIAKPGPASGHRGIRLKEDE